MLTKGEATSRRGKGGDDVNRADVNLTGPKIKENACSRFRCYNWMMKI
jgi:hypothetical protein